MLPLIVIVVLTTWGVGAAVGSASDYLVAAVLGVVVTITLLAVAGGVAAWQNRGQASAGAFVGMR